MFATRIAPAFAVTWSMPQITVSQLPLPESSRTFTGTSVEAGATPRTPVVL
jgi:hypothetical protein